MQPTNLSSSSHRSFSIEIELMSNSSHSNESNGAHPDTLDTADARSNRTRFQRLSGIRAKGRSLATITSKIPSKVSSLFRSLRCPIFQCFKNNRTHLVEDRISLSGLSSEDSSQNRLNRLQVEQPSINDSLQQLPLHQQIEALDEVYQPSAHDDETDSLYVACEHEPHLFSLIMNPTYRELAYSDSSLESDSSSDCSLDATSHSAASVSSINSASSTVIANNLTANVTLTDSVNNDSTAVEHSGSLIVGTLLDNGDIVEGIHLLDQQTQSNQAVDADEVDEESQSSGESGSTEWFSAKSVSSSSNQPAPPPVVTKEQKENYLTLFRLIAEGMPAGLIEHYNRERVLDRREIVPIKQTLVNIIQSPSVEPASLALIADVFSYDPELKQLASAQLAKA